MTHCVWCTEPVQTEDITLRFANGPVAHHCSAVRMAIGSVAHQQRCCDCYVPGSTESDNPQLSLREAAKEAVAYWLGVHGCPSRPLASTWPRHARWPRRSGGHRPRQGYQAWPQLTPLPRVALPRGGPPAVPRARARGSASVSHLHATPGLPLGARR